MGTKTLIAYLDVRQKGFSENRLQLRVYRSSDTELSYQLVSANGILFALSNMQLQERLPTCLEEVEYDDGLLLDYIEDSLRTSVYKPVDNTYRITDAFAALSKPSTGHPNTICTI